MWNLSVVFAPVELSLKAFFLIGCLYKVVFANSLVTAVLVVLQTGILAPEA